MKGFVCTFKHRFKTNPEILSGTVALLHTGLHAMIGYTFRGKTATCALKVCLHNLFHLHGCL